MESKNAPAVSQLAGEKLRDFFHLVYGMPCGQCGFSVGAHVPENELKCTSARAYQIAAALSALGESKEKV